MDSATLSPPQDGNPGALANRRMNFKFMRKPLCATQPQALALAGGVTVFQSEFNVGDARSLIFEDQPEARPPVILDYIKVHGASTAVIEHIAGQFTGGRHHLGLIDESKSEGHSL